jgi:hypothetical protein
MSHANRTSRRNYRTSRAVVNERGLHCHRCATVPPLDMGFTYYRVCGHVICDRCCVPEPHGAYWRWRCPVCRGHKAVET